MSLLTFIQALNQFLLKLNMAILNGFFAGKLVVNPDMFFYEMVMADFDDKTDMSCMQYTVNGAAMERFLKVDGRIEGKCIDQGYPYGQGP